jgi:hypothetical protein
VTGLVVVSGDVGKAAGDVAVGPGPTYYTLQSQPAPGACQYRAAANGQTLPVPNCTPGAISPKVTQDTLATTICRTGYTKSIRPPASITEIEKRENAAAYGYTGSLKDVEYDHLVPLELGGDPNDPRNLWIEPGASPNSKDGVESRLHGVTVLLMAVIAGLDPAGIAGIRVILSRSWPVRLLVASGSAARWRSSPSDERRPEARGRPSAA